MFAVFVSKTLSKPPRKYCIYNPENLEITVKTVEQGMPKRAATKEFSIPSFILCDKSTSRYPLGSGLGRCTVFTNFKVNDIVKWVKIMTRKKRRQCVISAKDD